MAQVHLNVNYDTQYPSEQGEQAKHTFPNKRCAFGWSVEGMLNFDMVIAQTAFANVIYRLWPFDSFPFRHHYHPP